MKAIQIISQDLFDKVRSRFQNLEMGDETGAVTIDNELSVNELINAAQLTTTERNATSPQAGSIIWNTTDTKLQVYNGTTWDNLN